MIKSFVFFVVGLLVFTNTIIGYLTLPDNGSEGFIAALSAMFMVVGIIGMFNTKTIRK